MSGKERREVKNVLDVVEEIKKKERKKLTDTKVERNIWRERKKKNGEASPD